MSFKKLTVLFTLLLIFMLASCGGDMRSWPYVDLDFDIDDVTCIYIDYLNRQDESMSFKCYSIQMEGFNSSVDFLETFHTNPRTINKNVSDFNRRISFYFILADKSVIDFKAYYYSGARTYFWYNDELRLFPADFGGCFLDFIERENTYFTFF